MKKKIKLNYLFYVLIALIGLIVISSSVITLKINFLSKPNPLIYLSSRPGMETTIGMIDTHMPFCSAPTFLDANFVNRDITSTKVMWSPQRDQIFYLTYSLRQDSSSLWSMKPDGSGLKQVSPLMSHARNYFDISHDQNYVSITDFSDQGDPSTWDIWLIDLRANATSKFMTTTWVFAWSPIDNLVAIYRGLTLYLVQPDGAIRNVYSDNLISGSSLVWSPNGHRIAFTTNSVSSKQWEQAYVAIELR
jgi:hypothetical protein